MDVHVHIRVFEITRVVWNWERISVAGQGNEKAAAAHVDDAVLQRDCLLPRPDHSRGGWDGRMGRPAAHAGRRGTRVVSVRPPALDRRAPTQHRTQPRA